MPVGDVWGAGGRPGEAARGGSARVYILARRVRHGAGVASPVTCV